MRQNERNNGMMYITELDKGLKDLKMYSDKIKKTKDISDAELEKFSNELHKTVILAESLGADKNNKMLRDYFYNDLCDGVIQELCKTKGLSHYKEYKKF